MTKKDYVKLAAICKNLASDPRFSGTVEQRLTLTEVIGRVADCLQADNPHFDRRRFLQACGA